MRKAIIYSLVIGLVAAALLVGPAEAAKKKKTKKTTRVATGAYDNPAIGVPGVAGTSTAGGAVEFPIMTTENYINVEITDDGGGDVMATMSQNTDPSDASWEIFATFCGATEEPVPVEPGIPVRVSVYTIPGPSQPSCVGPATSGEIKATFSNLP